MPEDCTSAISAAVYAPSESGRSRVTARGGPLQSSTAASKICEGLSTSEREEKGPKRGLVESQRVGRHVLVGKVELEGLVESALRVLCVLEENVNSASGPLGPQLAEAWTPGSRPRPLPYPRPRPRHRGQWMRPNGRALARPRSATS